MIYNQKNNSDLPERILEGVRKAFDKLVRENAAKGVDMVIGEPDGTYKIVPAIDLLDKPTPEKE